MVKFRSAIESERNNGIFSVLENDNSKTVARINFSYYKINPIKLTVFGDFKHSDAIEAFKGRIGHVDDLPAIRQNLYNIAKALRDVSQDTTIEMTTDDLQAVEKLLKENAENDKLDLGARAGAAWLLGGLKEASKDMVWKHKKIEVGFVSGFLSFDLSPHLKEKFRPKGNDNTYYNTATDQNGFSVNLLETLKKAALEAEKPKPAPAPIASSGQNTPGGNGTPKPVVKAETEQLPPYDRKVETIQSVLKLLDVVTGPYWVDGIYWKSTNAAFKKYLEKYGDKDKHDVPDDIKNGHVANNAKGTMDKHADAEWINKVHKFYESKIKTDLEFRMTLSKNAIGILLKHADQDSGGGRPDPHEAKAVQSIVKLFDINDTEPKKIIAALDDILKADKDKLSKATPAAPEAAPPPAPAAAPPPAPAPAQAAAAAAPGTIFSVMGTTKSEKRTIDITGHLDTGAPLSYKHRDSDTRKQLSHQAFAGELLKRKTHTEIDAFLTKFVLSQNDDALTTENLKDIYEELQKNATNGDDKYNRAIYAYALSRLPVVIKAIPDTEFEKDSVKADFLKAHPADKTLLEAKKILNEIAGKDLSAETPAVTRKIDPTAEFQKRAANVAAAADHDRLVLWNATRVQSTHFIEEKDRNKKGELNAAVTAFNGTRFTPIDNFSVEQQRKIGRLHIDERGRILYMYEDQNHHVRVMDFTDERNDVSGKDRLNNLHAAMFTDDIVRKADEMYRRAVAHNFDVRGETKFNASIGIVKEIKAESGGPDTHGIRLHIADTNCDGRITADEIHLVTNEYKGWLADKYPTMQAHGDILNRAWNQTPAEFRSERTTIAEATSGKILPVLFGGTRDAAALVDPNRIHGIFDNAAVGRNCTPTSESGPAPCLTETTDKAITLNQNYKR
jgi:hypothetical protein